MVLPTTDEAVRLSNTDAHRMRITSAGSITAYVRFALSFLRANPSRPLILHTQQLSPAPSETETKPASSSSTLTPSLLNTPKLISVVEIIKREYLALLNSSDNGKGKTGTRGIWQYNETGLLPVPSSALDEEGNAGLIRVLEGKTKPKMTHKPYLLITLSTKPLGLEEGVGIACQYVLATRRRSRKRAKDQEAETKKGGGDTSIRIKNGRGEMAGNEQIPGDEGKDVFHAAGTKEFDVEHMKGTKRKPESSQEAGRGRKRVRVVRTAKPAR